MEQLKYLIKLETNYKINQLKEDVKELKEIIKDEDKNKAKLNLIK